MKITITHALALSLPALAVASAVSAATPVVDPAKLLEHIKVLSSDDFEGRLPGTAGEDKTVDYLTQQFKALGLEPGNPDGSYVQKVDLVGITSHPSASFSGCGAEVALKFPDTFVAGTTQVKPEVAISNSDLVFVGYGVSAPEYGWDDYKDVDVRGKTIVMLVNDPAIPDPKDPGQLDDSMFKGKAMTYYGRWTYKYEIAAAKGAAGALIVHETKPAAYPYEVVKSGWNGEKFVLKSPDNNGGDVPVRGWMTEQTSRALFGKCGLDFDALKKAALSKDFKPVALKAGFTAKIDNEIRQVGSKNVVAKITGSDPKHKDEFLVYTAHWDHLGKKDTDGKTVIYHGALDNASGIAGILEIARAFKADKAKPKRSVLFLAVTAEEQGLLGSAQYAATPLYPLAKTVANLNIDVMNPWGKTRDVSVVGSGQTTLEDLLVKEAKKQGRVVKPDATPETGGYFRSDHFELVKKGVPALNMEGGEEVVGKPEGFGAAKAKEYTANDYHKPSDEVKPDWDLSGAAQDAELLFNVGRDVVDGLAPVDFKPTSEFKATRDALLKGAAQ